MGSKVCEYPDCLELASLMKCFRCGQRAACMEHSRKEPTLGDRYICFACMVEVDEIIRQKREAMVRAAEQKELMRARLYSIICPMCGGEGGWDGEVVYKTHTVVVSQSFSNTYSDQIKTHYTNEDTEEKKPYYISCYLCNRDDDGDEPGRITTAQYQELEARGKVHQCPICRGKPAVRTVSITRQGSYWDSFFREEEGYHRESISDDTCRGCDGKILVSEDQFIYLATGKKPQRMLDQEKAAKEAKEAAEAARKAEEKSKRWITDRIFYFLFGESE